MQFPSILSVGDTYISEIMVYFDDRQPGYEAWSYAMYAGDECIDSGGIVADDIHDAIDQVIAIADVDAEAKEFCIDADGLSAQWMIS